MRQHRFGHAEFDVVREDCVLQHCAAPHIMLTEMLRVLRPVQQPRVAWTQHTRLSSACSASVHTRPAGASSQCGTTAVLA